MPEERLPAGVRSVPDAVAWWADRVPDALALLPADERASPVTYHALQRRIEEVAARLTECGVGRGGAVAFQPDGRVEAAVTLLAAMHAGVAAPLAPAASESELTAILDRLAPEIVLVAERASPLARAAQQISPPVLSLADLHRPSHDVSLRGTKNPVQSLPQRNDETPRKLGMTPDDPDVVGFDECPFHRTRAAAPTGSDVAVVLSTSGTTGLPRGIPRTHDNLLATHAAYAAWLGPAALARVLIAAPLSFGMGLPAFVTAICDGRAAVLSGSGDPRTIVRAIERWQPTWAYIVPALLEEVLREAGSSGRLKTSAWVTIGGGGMAPASTLADRVAAEFGAPYLEGYGCGEVGVIAGAALGKRPEGGVFERVLMPEIATVDADGAPTVAGVPGEIVVRGPQVFAGYAGDPEGSNAAFFPGGWFRTGDVGVLDERGRLRLTGRAKEMINRGGEKVAPAEVEAALLAHPAVAEAAVFPLAKDGIGEEIAAAVVLHPGAVADERQLRRAVARRLAPAKVPRRVWFRDSLPHTASGKVQRRELARIYTGSADGDAGGRAPS